MRASKIMQDRVFANKKIEPIWNTVVTKYIPDEKGEMRSVRLRNVQTNEERELPVACVFVAIGHDPNTKAYQGKLETDPDGYLIARHMAESKHPGVFVAGERRSETLSPRKDRLRSELHGDRQACAGRPREKDKAAGARPLARLHHSLSIGFPHGAISRSPEFTRG